MADLVSGRSTGTSTFRCIQELSQRFEENADRIGHSHRIYRATGEILERRTLDAAARQFLIVEMRILGAIIENAPGQPVELKARYADLQCEHGDPGVAARILLPMLSSNELTHEIFSSYAIVLEKSGREREALDYHRKAIHLSGKIVGRIALRLASLLYRLGEIDEALAWARHCDTIAPNETKVLSLLMEILSAAGQTSEAVRRTHELRILQNKIGEIH